MKHRLYIVEGLPCSGKSTLSAYAARLLERRGKVCFVDEGTGDHPADYEYHALAPAGFLGPESRIVSLSHFTGQELELLLPYKIYDALPWKTEKPLMLEKWRQFVREAEEATVYVFNCVLLQNSMCETMMRFGFSEAVSQDYIREIAQIIAPLEPVVIYLHNSDICTSILQTAASRPGWLEGFQDYHLRGAYGRQTGAEGFGGLIACLEERQARELCILSNLPLKSFVLRQPHRDWSSAEKEIERILEATVC